MKMFKQLRRYMANLVKKCAAPVVVVSTLATSAAVQAAATAAPATDDITGTITNFVTGWVTPIGVALVVIGIVSYLIRSW